MATEQLHVVGMGLNGEAVEDTGNGAPSNRDEPRVLRRRAPESEEQRVNAVGRYAKLGRPPLQVVPLPVGLGFALGGPDLVLDPEQEAAARGDLEVHPRLVAGDLSMDPVPPIGILARKRQFLEEEPEAEVALGMCAEAQEVVVQEPRKDPGVT